MKHKRQQQHEQQQLIGQQKSPAQSKESLPNHESNESSSSDVDESEKSSTNNCHQLEQTVSESTDKQLDTVSLEKKSTSQDTAEIGIEKDAGYREVFGITESSESFENLTNDETNANTQEAQGPSFCGSTNEQINVSETQPMVHQDSHQSFDSSVSISTCYSNDKTVSNVNNYYSANSSNPPKSFNVNEATNIQSAFHESYWSKPTEVDQPYSVNSSENDKVKQFYRNSYDFPASSNGYYNWQSNFSQVSHPLITDPSLFPSVSSINFYKTSSNCTHLTNGNGFYNPSKGLSYTGSFDGNRHSYNTAATPFTPSMNTSFTNNPASVELPADQIVSIGLEAGGTDAVSTTKQTRQFSSSIDDETWQQQDYKVLKGHSSQGFKQEPSTIQLQSNWQSNCTLPQNWPSSLPTAHSVRPALVDGRSNTSNGFWSSSNQFLPVSKVIIRKQPVKLVKIFQLLVFLATLTRCLICESQLFIVLELVSKIYLLLSAIFMLLSQCKVKTAMLCMLSKRLL